MILLLSNDPKILQKLKKLLLKNGVFSTAQPKEALGFDFKACISDGCELPSDMTVPCLDLHEAQNGEELSFIERVAPELHKTYSYRHFFAGCSKDQVFYLGYPLELTDTEFAIVRLLTRLGGNALRGEIISRLCSSSTNAACVSIHICNINKKAKSIGGRALIKNDLKKGYFLNKEM